MFGKSTIPFQSEFGQISIIRISFEANEKLFEWNHSTEQTQHKFPMKLGATFWISFHAHRIQIVMPCIGDTLLRFLHYLNDAALVVLFDTTMCLLASVLNTYCIQYSVFIPFKIPFVPSFLFNNAGHYASTIHPWYSLYTQWTRFIQQNVG